MEANGDIAYIYLVAGVNSLLLIIVLFNLWLNSAVIFSYNKKYYQLLRLNGASFVNIIKDELKIFLLLIIVSSLLAIIVIYFTSKHYSISLQYITVSEVLGICLFFLLITSLVSLFPVIANASSTIFFNKEAGSSPKRFSFRTVIVMVVVQYAIVIFIVLIGVGINRQLVLINEIQLGGNNQDIIVIDEQPQSVVSEYHLLQNELMKCPDIESVTAAMQLPGSTIRDIVTVQLPDKDKVMIPVLVVSENFFETFNINPLCGQLFAPITLTYKEEEDILVRKLEKNEHYSFCENIVINKKAMLDLGFQKPEDAIGKEIYLDHHMLDYFNQYTISAVVENFTYTTIYEKEIPLIILQRNMFRSCFIIRFVSNREKEGIVSLNKIWQKVFPDFPIKYTWLKDSYKTVYHNELNAQRLVSVFSILLFMITILGLIIFMAFMSRSRVKEIGIRKINGATRGEIIWMLNASLLKWILLAYILAVPVSWYVFDRWLQNFAYKTSLTWWLCVLTGVTVLGISAICISVQAWKAANANPIDSIKNE